MLTNEEIRAYVREIATRRYLYAAIFLVTGISTMVAAIAWPKTYTSYATIYADNSNILKPLMEGNAVATQIVDEARLAREIMFQRQFRDEVLLAAGVNISLLNDQEKDRLIEEIQRKLAVTNVGRSPASLIRVAYTDHDPVRAFRVANKYATLFILQSAAKKRDESRSAFDFIQNQVAAYQRKLQESEDRLSRFKTENYAGTLVDANSRISRYRTDIEELELDLLQLHTEKRTLEEELDGQRAVTQDLTELNALRARINSLQRQLDILRAQYKETYPDVVYLKNQIAELSTMLEGGGGFRCCLRAGRVGP